MLDRVYFHYSDLEEYRDGMWRIVMGEQRKANVQAAAKLMRDSAAFEYSMRRAVDEWPNSCLHNLTSENSNRIAWLGHSGCCLGAGSPEENTRCGWHTLNPSEQDEANRVAALVLADWCEANETEFQPCLLKLMEADCGA
jgi:hypothetical protein